MLERAAEACIALADTIRTAENEAEATERVEAHLLRCGLPEDYATALRWMAQRAISSTFEGNPKATMGSRVRRA